MTKNRRLAFDGAFNTEFKDILKIRLVAFLIKLTSTFNNGFGWQYRLMLRLPLRLALGVGVE